MGYNSVNIGYIGGGGGSSLSSITYVPLSFEIGQPGALINAGETELTITAGNAIEYSEFITLNSGFVQPDLSDVISYTIVYTPSSIMITFNQAVVTGQKYYIKYAKWVS